MPALERLWQRRRGAFPNASTDAFAELDRAGSQDGNSLNGRICVEQTPRPGAMAALVAHLGSDGRLRHARGEAFFAWRFADPFRTFRFLYWDDGALQGYLILSAHLPASGRRDIEIVDWEATNAEVKDALLRAAIGWGRFDTLTIWSATLAEETRAMLRDAGFRYIRPRLRDRSGRLETNWPGFLIRPTTDANRDDEWTVGGRDLLDLSNWDLRRAYSD